MSEKLRFLGLDVHAENGFSLSGIRCTYCNHEAGNKWAEERDIQDEGACDDAGDTSNSPSFAGGCKSFVNRETSSEDDNPN